MTAEQSNTLQILVKSYDSFIVALRMGDGLDRQNFDAFCRSVGDVAQLWKSSENLPKACVDIFVDAYTAMVASSYLYPDVRGEEIRQLADKMQMQIRMTIEISKD